MITNRKGRSEGPFRIDLSRTAGRQISADEIWSSEITFWTLKIFTTFSMAKGNDRTDGNNSGPVALDTRSDDGSSRRKSTRSFFFFKSSANFDRPTSRTWLISTGTVENGGIFQVESPFGL